MNEMLSMVGAWLTDLLVLGTALLAVTCLALVFLRQPAARMALARGTLLGLAMLCVLAALLYLYLSAGIRVFSTQQPDAVTKFLAEQPAVRERYFDANISRARVSFSLVDLPAAIEETFAAHGWIAW